jgi:hypothetical protein
MANPLTFQKGSGSKLTYEAYSLDFVGNRFLGSQFFFLRSM